MEKVKPTYYNGLEFVQVSSLPFAQAFQLETWLSVKSYINLTLNNIKLEDCILYSEYEYWFDYCYKKAERLQLMDI